MDIYGFSENLRKAVAAAVNVQNSLAGIAQVLNSGMNGFAESMKKITAQINRSIENHSINIETGWWYPRNFLSEIDVEDIDNALRNELTDKSFTKLVVSVSRKNDNVKLANTIERWNSYDFIPKNRKRILSDAINAHIHRKYTLSIPVLLAQIEHFQSKLFPESQEIKITFKNKTIEEIFGEQQINFARHFGLTDYGQVPASEYFRIYPIYFYFVNVLFASEKLRAVQKIQKPDLFKLSDPNNRHTILHGERASYPSESRSLKQILFLDNLFSEMDYFQSLNKESSD